VLLNAARSAAARLDSETVSIVDRAPLTLYNFGVLYKREIAPAGNKSWFLFGPRQTGKSTYARSLLTVNYLYIDLLPQREFLGYATTFRILKPVGVM
jgi:hypothetical protein